MDVLAILDKLDTYLSECSRLPLVGKLMVDEEEVFALIDDLRAAIPQELEQAKWLLKERERILQEARREAEEIIKDAQGQIASLASESAIAKEARIQAEELMEKAREVAREINLGAREYADEIMKKVEDLLTEMLETVRAGRRELAVEKDKTTGGPQPETVSAVASTGDEVGSGDDEEDGEYDDEEDFVLPAKSPRKRGKGKGRGRD